MVFKYIQNLKFQKGITLIELIVVIFMIAVFSGIMIADFPKIQRQSALLRATYSMAQDFRKAEDMGTSGVQTLGADNCPVPVKGYGVYVDTTQPTTYLIYADIAGVDGTSDKRYNSGVLCSQSSYYQASSNCGIRITIPVPKDCVVETISVNAENASLSLEKIIDVNADGSDGSHSYDDVSVNFNPPNPTTTITASGDTALSAVKVFLKNTDGSSRKVLINKSGLIDVQ
ncbi:MAG: prepilin-type N-terminal cleavage/methylation domain-containing protein [Candidatus Staskawiczbacteria bacterium]|nr:prepilin-type N-terminal cleavage/methylation domain-containing protein [Candidatus Staskawiczbacteria bacterium]